MNIGIKEAIAHFYSNSSFELIYSEALANALDAHASTVSINIETTSFDAVDSLKIQIEDNGDGFNDHNFDKFCNLLKKEDKRHKGLGRLVYLNYFKDVKIESVFSNNQKRCFVFNEHFVGDNQLTSLKDNIENYSRLTFTNYCKEKIKSHDYINPDKIKEYLTKQFLPRLYALKQQKRSFNLTIKLSIEKSIPKNGLTPKVVEMSLDNLPFLQEVEIKDPGLDLYDTKFTMLYLVDNNKYTDKPITAICVDGRAIDFPILKDAIMPGGTYAIFLLQSDFFDSKTNDSRQGLALAQEDQETIEHVFSDKVSEILNQKVPAIRERNRETEKRLSERFPHLSGLFPNNTVGLIDEDKSLSHAQRAFFNQQKEILNATKMTDELYALSLNHSARILTEYILYRNFTIKKIESVTGKDDEGTIHNLIIPKRHIFRKNDFFDVMFNNNAWILDDKYMTFRSVLSDEELSKLIVEISDTEERTNDSLRPDIAFVFSDDINTSEHPVDVVVVELKKREETFLNNTRVIDQLEQRARRLLCYYNTKIQRMWFFGIIDFDRQIKTKFKESWYPLYSNGTAFFKEELLFPADEQGESVGETKYPVAITALSYDALFKDASARNEAFMRIIREGIRRNSENQ